MNEHNQTVSVEPSVAILRMISGFRAARAIYITAKLGIADLLKDEPKGSGDWRSPPNARVVALPSHACAGQRRHFRRRREGTLYVDAHRRYARSDVPGSLRAWAILVLGEEHYEVWGDLMHSVRTGEPAFEHVFGMGVFQDEAQHPEHAKIFDEAMTNLTGMYNAAVLANYPFWTIDKLIDVGGGDGRLIVTILEANPQMTGVLFDLPHVAEKAKQRIADAGLVGRCEVVTGDALVSVPSRGDAYILSRVVNSFDNERAIVILQNCHRTITHNGKVLLVERVLPDRVEHSNEAQGSVMSDLNMLVMMSLDANALRRSIEPFLSQLALP